MSICISKGESYSKLSAIFDCRKIVKNDIHFIPVVSFVIKFEIGIFSKEFYGIVVALSNGKSVGINSPFAIVDAEFVVSIKLKAYFVLIDFSTRHKTSEPVFVCVREYSILIIFRRDSKSNDNVSIYCAKIANDFAVLKEFYGILVAFGCRNCEKLCAFSKAGVKLNVATYGHINFITNPTVEFVSAINVFFLGRSSFGKSNFCAVRNFVTAKYFSVCIVEGYGVLVNCPIFGVYANFIRAVYHKSELVCVRTSRHYNSGCSFTNVNDGVVYVVLSIVLSYGDDCSNLGSVFNSRKICDCFAVDCEEFYAVKITFGCSKSVGIKNESFYRNVVYVACFESIYSVCACNFLSVKFYNYGAIAVLCIKNDGKSNDFVFFC